MSTAGPDRSLLLRGVEIGGRPDRSVLVRDDRIHEVGPADVVGEPDDVGMVVEGRGGALLVGLHDHHIHLQALAERDQEQTVWCGAPDVTGASGLVDVLRRESDARRDHGWMKGVGWDDATIGWPDRRDLDLAVADRPLRLQHRSGALWVLNSAALARLDLDLVDDLPDGLETDRAGRPTGRLFGADDWLREQIGGGAPDLTDVSRDLAASGVTGVTDASAHNGPTELAELGRQRRDGRLRQHVHAMTAPGVTDAPDGVATGAVKLVLADGDGRHRDELVDVIRHTHDSGRPVAVHAATGPTLERAVTALVAAGPRRRDRIEHATVVPAEQLRPLVRSGVTVVVQPDGPRTRGSDPDRHRCRSLIEAGVPVAAGTDAPHGPPDPFTLLARAVSAGDEAVDPEVALAMLSGPAHEPAATPRRIRVGAAADLCLLDRPWADARKTLDRRMVAATVIGGELVHDRTRT